MRHARVAAALALTMLLGGCAFTTPPAGPSGDEGKRPVSAVQETDEGAGGDASSAALDAYVKAEEAAMASMIDLSVYSSASVSAEYPNTVVFSYVYVNQLDPAAAAEYFDGMLTAFQGLCDSAVFPGMEMAGVVDPAASYLYFNPDGSLLWEHTFTKS